MVYFGALIVLLLVALYVFMTVVVFPSESDLVSVYLAARSGGNTIFIRPEGFTVFNAVVIGIVAVVSVVAAMLVHYKKAPLTIVLGILLITAVTYYIGALLANAFEEVWGGWWTAVGVIIAAILGLGLLALFALLFESTERRKHR
jgi:uncharacterized membrane protein